MTLYDSKGVRMGGIDGYVVDRTATPYSPPSEMSNVSVAKVEDEFVTPSLPSGTRMNSIIPFDYGIQSTFQPCRNVEGEDFEA